VPDATIAHSTMARLPLPLIFAALAFLRTSSAWAPSSERGLRYSLRRSPSALHDAVAVADFTAAAAPLADVAAPLTAAAAPLVDAAANFADAVSSAAFATGNIPTPFLVAVAAAGGAAMALIRHVPSSPAPSADPSASSEAPYAEGRYNPASAAEFFGARPAECAIRAFRIFFLSGAYLCNAFLDRILGREDTAGVRPAQLAELLTRLGPAFVKVGQALSTRADLLPPEYAAGLALLQDAVPPFPSDEARAAVERELGSSIGSTFAAFSAEPVAAASIGQVYKATVRGTG